MGLQGYDDRHHIGSWTPTTRPLKQSHPVRDRLSLSAVSGALVGDIADVVRIETLRSTALVVNRNIDCKQTVDLSVGHQARQPCEAALRPQHLCGPRETGPCRQRQRAADAD